MGSKDSKEASVFVNEENTRTKRPGLGLERERANFSMKPKPSQPDLCPEPSIDIEKLEDPDDYFAAFERMQNAKKELRKQRGEPLEDCDSNHTSLAHRPRRPGLPGFRKPVTYEHQSYGSHLQEALRKEKLSATRKSVLSETNFANPLPPERVSDVSSAMNSKTSVLDELISFDYDDLDEAGVQSFVLQKLNIKSIDINRPPFPKLHSPKIRDSSINSSSEAVPALHDSIQKARDTKRIAGEKPPDFRDLLREISPRNQQLPTFSKSPFASISSLKRKLSQLNSSMDPYSSLDIDSSPDIISYGKTPNGEKAKQSDTRDDLHGIVNGKGTTGIVISSLSSAGDIGGPSKESKGWLGEVSKGDQIVTNRDSLDLRRSPGHEETIAVPANDVDFTSAPMEQEDQVVAAPKSVQQKMLNTSFAVEHSSTNGGEPNIGEPLNARCIFYEALNEKMVRSIETEESTVPSEENVSAEKVNIRTAKSKAESHVLNLEKPHKIRSYVKETEELAAPSEENLSDEIVNRKTGKAKSNAPVPEEPSKKKRKHCAAVLSKANDKKRRFSLFDAGTKLEAGVRRSSRIRMRPLEYWKGEKFLYGRVHKSLASVIGVKYASPTKDSKQPAFKVKSFVSGEYKDALEYASY